MFSVLLLVGSIANAHWTIPGSKSVRTTMVKNVTTKMKTIATKMHSQYPLDRTWVKKYHADCTLETKMTNVTTQMKTKMLQMLTKEMKSRTKKI